MTWTRLVFLTAPLWLAVQAASVWVVLVFGLGTAGLVALVGLWTSALAIGVLSAKTLEARHRRALSYLGEAVGTGALDRRGNALSYVNAMTANLCARIERALVFMTGFEQLSRPALIIDGAGTIIKMTAGLTVLAPECAETDTASALLGTDIDFTTDEGAIAVRLGGSGWRARWVALGPNRVLIELEKPGIVLPVPAYQGLCDALSGGHTGYRFAPELLADVPELDLLTSALECLDDSVAALDALAAGHRTPVVGDSAPAGINHGLAAQVGALARALETLEDERDDQVQARQNAEHRLEKIGALIDLCRQTANDLTVSAQAAQTTASAALGAVTQGRDGAIRIGRSGTDASAGTQKAAEAARAAGGHIAEVDAVTRRIDAMVAGIEEVAFRTNLLALNAAVEAARAGDKGAGFAVVASEVRELAKNSAQTSKEIRSLIKKGMAEAGAGNAQAASLVGLLDEVGVHLLNLSDETSMIKSTLDTGAGAFETLDTAIDAVSQGARTGIERGFDH